MATEHEKAMMSIISLIRENHLSFIKLFHSNLNQYGGGVLNFAKGDSEQVDVGYSPMHTVKSRYIVERIRTMVSEIMESDGKLTLHNRMIINLPQFKELPEGVESLEPMFFVIMVKGVGRIFELLPQTVNIANEQFYFYQMIADPTPEELERLGSATGGGSAGAATGGATGGATEGGSATGGGSAGAATEGSAGGVSDKNPSYWTIGPTNTGQKFIKVCEKALVDDRLWRRFRAMREFREVIGYEDEDYGGRLIQHIEKGGAISDVIGDIRNYVNLDDVGGPTKYYYAELGWDMSPTTLRYMNTAVDIGRQLGIIDGKRIIEIGCGYGGLAAVMHRMFDDIHYTAVEIEPVRSVAQKYLTEMEIPIVPITSEQIPKSPVSWDILISQLALCELTEEGIVWYINNVFPSITAAVYLEMNIWEEDRKTRLLDLLQKEFESVSEYLVEPEHPDWKRYIWVCKRAHT